MAPHMILAARTTKTKVQVSSCSRPEGTLSIHGGVLNAADLSWPLAIAAEAPFAWKPTEGPTRFRSVWHVVPFQVDCAQSTRVFD
jgi:hypothetical protein